MNAGQGDNTVMCTSGNDSQNFLEEKVPFHLDAGEGGI